MPLNLPILLTWLRILMIPLLVGVFYMPHSWIADHDKNLVATRLFSVLPRLPTGSTVILRVTQPDVVLRRLPRSGRRQADGCHRTDHAGLARTDLEGFIAVIIIGREIAISALREWMAQIGRSKSVAVSFLGKIKTVSQMTAIILLLYHDRLFQLNMHGGISSSMPMRSVHFLIYFAAILTLWSMAYYLKMALPELTKEE